MSALYCDVPSGAKVMLATTVYDSPDASYTFSISRSREALHKAGIPTAYLLLSGNCHVDDARNTVVRDFLATDCIDLVFLDADVSWEPEHLIQLCEFDCNLVGGVYPYRRDGGDEMPVRMKKGCYVADENGLLEVEGLPTGFMRVRRHVLETLADGAEKFTKDTGGDIPILFERSILNGGRMGGDIGFCAKWRATGGKVYAAANLRLGHCGKQILRDSLSASLRRQAGLSLKHVCERIREGRETQDDYAEAIRANDNKWGAQADVLAASVLLARKATGPIIEAGSGLTTVLMAAATEHTVWCIEHHPFYAMKTEMMARSAGVENISIVTCPLKDEWYDLSEDMGELPARFSVGLVDGPPRLLGDRMKFFDLFGDRVDAIVCDDADDRGYLAKLMVWAGDAGRAIEWERRTAVIMPKKERVAA